VIALLLSEGNLASAPPVVIPDDSKLQSFLKSEAKKTLHAHNAQRESQKSYSFQLLGTYRHYSITRLPAILDGDTYFSCRD
jgi:hypothetical protein